MVEVLVAMLLVSMVFTSATELFRVTTITAGADALRQNALQVAQSTLSAAAGNGCGAEPLIDATGSSTPSRPWATNEASVDQRCANAFYAPGTAGAAMANGSYIQGDPPGGSANPGGYFRVSIGRNRSARVYVRSWFIPTSNLAGANSNPCTTTSLSELASLPMGIEHQVTVTYHGGTVQLQSFDSLPSTPAYSSIDYDGVVVEEPKAPNVMHEGYVTVQEGSYAPITRYESPAGCIWIPLVPAGPQAAGPLVIQSYSASGVAGPSATIAQGTLDPNGTGEFSPVGLCFSNGAVCPAGGQTL
jgi:type II secretory pathway pseudopilin PulG